MVQILNDIYDDLKQASVTNILMFLLFSILLTLIISSQNFFFQRIIENGISKKDIIAEKTITVIDTKRTEQHKKDVAMNIEPILIPAEDDFIKVNLDTLENSIVQIRHKKVEPSIKRAELGMLFDIAAQYKKDYFAA